MTVEEYEQRWEVILQKFGGSLSTPSGWTETELFFSCVKPPIAVAMGSSLTSEQRAVLIRRAEVKFGVRS